MPRVTWMLQQRNAAEKEYRQKAFARVLIERKADGLTQKSIAEDLGVDPATLSIWKRNCGNMSLGAFQRLVEVADLSDEEILLITRGKFPRKQKQ